MVTNLIQYSKHLGKILTVGPSWNNIIILFVNTKKYQNIMKLIFYTTESKFVNNRQMFVSKLQFDYLEDNTGANERA